MQYLASFVTSITSMWQVISKVFVFSESSSLWEAAEGLLVSLEFLELLLEMVNGNLSLSVVLEISNGTFSSSSLQINSSNKSNALVVEKNWVFLT